jgi:membrane associated rhomboid family serine protease
MVLPLGDLEKTRIVPLATYSLIALNVVMFLFQLDHGKPFTASYAATPFEISHGVDLPLPDEAQLLLQAPPEIQRQLAEQEHVPFPVWLTLFTAMFLHGSPLHLAGNMLYLWIFGDNVEDRLGRGRFTILYLVSTVVACLSHVLGNVGSAEVMVGASGAIAGLMGAYLVLFPRVKVWVVFLFVPFKMRAIWYLLVWIGMQFLIMLDKKSNVAWLAHVGGFICGIVLAFLLKPKDATPALPRRA